MKNEEWIAQKAATLSKKIGRCVYEMVEKGKCAKKNECQFPHVKESGPGGARHVKKLCFRELEGPSKCH